MTDIVLFLPSVSPEGQVLNVSGDVYSDGSSTWVEFIDGEGVTRVAMNFPFIYRKPSKGGGKNNE